jgi:hypothetical protein
MQTIEVEGKFTVADSDKLLPKGMLKLVWLRPPLDAKILPSDLQDLALLLDHPLELEMA